MGARRHSFLEKVSWVAGVVVAIFAVLVYFLPSKEHDSPSVISQKAGDNSTEVGSVQGDVTINNQVLQPRDIPLKSSGDTARAELQQLGVGWSSESFVGAVVDGDLRSVELFLDGGMNPELNYKGASVVVYSLQPAAARRVEVLKSFIKHGFNPNMNLLDTRIMPTYGSIPPHFDPKLTPEGYGAWNKTFVGPADLWIVIRASYAGPAPGDFDLLRLLANCGATFKVSLAFLKSFESIYGDTKVYWDVRNQVELLTRVAVTQRPKH